VKRDVRDRLLLPVLLPIGILVVIAAALFGFSRILLAVTHTAATATALIVAVAIVAISAVASSRPQIRASTIVSMLGATAGVAMLAGGIALAVVSEGGGEAPGGGEPGGAAGITVVAQDIAFDTGTIELAADTPTTITLDNRDAGVQHNVAIYADDTRSEVLFQGELLTGAGTIAYQIPPLPAGEYYFQCDVHPNMNGTVVVTAAGGEPGGGAEPTAEPPGDGGGETAQPPVVVAQNIAFDTDTITLSAGEPTSITMDNRDIGVPHNIAIYTEAELTTELFGGEIVTGPIMITYAIPALDAGEYYFLCVVHPNMNGTVIVQ